MRMEHLCYAVLDGSDGSRPIRLPNDRNAALLMKSRHHGLFWCSRAGGGCGASLIVAAGPILRPHFRHPSGSGDSCALARDPQRAMATYTHLAIQRALKVWLDGQGVTSRMEHRLVSGGRADIHVVVGDDAQTIEVQLSPMPGGEWLRRDALYRSEVSVVTWLYGPDVEARALDQVMERDVALQVEPDFAGGGSVRIGTFDGQAVQWAELAACKLTPEGFWTPHIDDARARTIAWRAAEDAAARAEAEEEQARRRRLQEAAREREKGLERVQQTRQSLPPVHASDVVRYTWTLASQQKLVPEAADWAPDIGWGWLDDLPPELRESATLLAYFVRRVEGGNVLTRLAFDDIPDPDGLIVTAFVNAGLIALCPPTLHPPRWQRPEM
jgi:hypothetical protein